MKKYQIVIIVTGRGVTASQLNIPSLTLFSVAGWGRVQLVVVYWANSVALLKVVIIDRSNRGSYA